MSYQDKIEFIIREPFTLTPNDQTIINQGLKHGLSWSDDHFKELKSRVREHLRKQQKGRCGFCRLRVPRSQFYPHIEHIVPKGANSRFMFEPRNLVWCCQRCNFDKGQTMTLGNPKVQDFPTRSEDFITLNPYHDPFFNHFYLIENLIIINIESSNKGKNTYDFYNLRRFEITEDRAYELKTELNNLTSHEILKILTLRLARERDTRILDLILYNLDKVDFTIID